MKTRKMFIALCWAMSVSFDFAFAQTDCKANLEDAKKAIV
jgi:hypothetical protein